MYRSATTSPGAAATTTEKYDKEMEENCSLKVLPDVAVAVRSCLTIKHKCTV